MPWIYWPTWPSRAWMWMLLPPYCWKGEEAQTANTHCKVKIKKPHRVIQAGSIRWKAKKGSKIHIGGLAFSWPLVLHGRELCHCGSIIVFIICIMWVYRQCNRDENVPSRNHHTPKEKKRKIFLSKRNVTHLSPLETWIITILSEFPCSLIPRSTLCDGIDLEMKASVVITPKYMYFTKYWQEVSILFSILCVSQFFFTSCSFQNKCYMILLHYFSNPLLVSSNWPSDCTVEILRFHTH